MSEQIVKIDETAGVIATFEQLMENNDYGEAIKIANQFLSRASEFEGQWRKLKRQAERQQSIVDYHKNVDVKRIAAKSLDRNLKEHHPDFYDKLVEFYHADIWAQLEGGDIEGNETHICGVTSWGTTGWGGRIQPDICMIMTNEISELHLHWIDNASHNPDKEFTFLKDYPKVAVAYSISGNYIHKPGKHGYSEDSSKNAYLLDDRLNIVPGNATWTSGDLCRTCWKPDYLHQCKGCGWPLDQNGDCILGCGA